MRVREEEEESENEFVRRARMEFVIVESAEIYIRVHSRSRSM